MNRNPGIQLIKDTKLMTDILKTTSPASNFSKLDIGDRCNAGCWFCYYKNNLNAPYKDTSNIFNEIDILKSSGCTDIEISGGEPTIHPDFFKIIEYARSSKLNFGLITNAISMDHEFTARLIYLEPSFIKFSIHGTREKHDKILKRKAFKNIIRTINQVKGLIPIRINVVVSEDTDIYFLQKIIDYSNFDFIDEVNLITLNTFGDCNSKPLTTIELFNKFASLDFSNAKNIKIKYAPLCILPDSTNVKNLNYFDMVHDDKDWNPWYSKDSDDIDFIQSNQNIINDILNKRLKLYHKTEECLNCEMSYRCDGFKGTK